MNVITVGVLTVSDRCAMGEAIDESGPALVSLLGTGIIKSAAVVSTALVPDSKDDIQKVVRQWCDDDNVVLILTTGGTGLSGRDVTPEATAELLEKTVPGIPRLMFKHSSAVTPLAALSRAVAGVRGGSLIINLPGSKKGCRECLEAVASVIPHAVDLIRGRESEVEGVHMGLKKKSSVPKCSDARRNVDAPYPHVSVEKAQKIILERVGFFSVTETAGYEQALGYVLAQQVIAVDDLPPFDASIKDGYAVNSKDTSLWRTLVGVSRTGDSEISAAKVCMGTCVRVSTGGPIPEGADAVVPFENTSLEPLHSAPENVEERRVKIEAKPTPGAEIRKKGSDFAHGEVLMQWGTYLNSSALGLLAAAGITSVMVFTKPVVAVMSSGDELIDPQQPPTPGKVRDSNRITLISLLREEKYEAVDLGIVPDDPDSLRDSLENGFRAADVVVTTGSMSMGERDFLKEVIKADFNGEICFGRVLVKPGQPVAFGMVNFEGKPKAWFGLPGNPTSSVVCCHLFLLPALRKMSGQRKVLPARVTTSTKLSSLSTFPQMERPQYLRGVLDLSTRSVSVPKNQNSSCIRSCVAANCLCIIPSSRVKPAEENVTFQYNEGLEDVETSFQGGNVQFGLNTGGAFGGSTGGVYGGSTGGAFGGSTGGVSSKNTKGVNGENTGSKSTEKYLEALILGNATFRV